MDSPLYRRAILVVLVSATALLTWRLLALSERYAEAPEPPEIPADLGADEQATIRLFRGASPSVAYITSLERRIDRFSMNVLEIPRGTGSGFIWDDDGHIVTNYHVIAEATSISVTLWDNSTHTAKKVGVAPDKDLAVLRIDAPKERLRPIPTGSSRDLLVGQKVLAIGNPFGFDQTLTTGVISGLGREIQSRTRRPIQDVIQTDAAINPGNSGGPLLDSAGHLIGVNTAIFSPTGAYAGVGFAVPVDTIKRIVPQLIAHGRVIRPGMGIRIDDRFLKRQGLGGVVIVAVAPNSAAEAAGLRGIRRDVFGRVELGDVILGIDDAPVADVDDLYRALDHHEVGNEVSVHLMRGGAEATVRVTLQPLD